MSGTCLVEFESASSNRRPQMLLGRNHSSALLAKKADSLVARHISLYHRTTLVRRTIIAYHDSEASLSLAEHASWRFSDVTCVIVVRHQRWDQRNVFQRWEL
jgi:hypothetical protein